MYKRVEMARKAFWILWWRRRRVLINTAFESYMKTLSQPCVFIEMMQ
jgi:hypothetical protein